MNRVTAFLAVTALLALGIWGLLVRFQTEQIETPPGSRSAVAFQLVDRGSPSSTVQAAQALWAACIVDLEAAPVQSLEQVTGDDRFRAVLSPALDRFEEQELRGCLNDLVLPHLRASAVEIERLPDQGHDRDRDGEM